MRSTSGQHFVTLDHLRALAALLVFSWHFLHFKSGYPVAFAQAPVLFPLAIFDEGHVGVALFMTLSGYLFAKLLADKKIAYGQFLWNRVLRLAPLLLAVVLINLAMLVAQGAPGSQLADFMVSVLRGALYPSLPNGGWSITIEFHFYVLLPLLLALIARSPWHALMIVVLAMVVRTAIYLTQGSVQHEAYFTLAGRIDQFTLGILAYRMRLGQRMGNRAFFIVTTCFLLFYAWFDAHGGFMRSPGYPSPQPLWIVMSSIEGLACACLIAWYDGRQWNCLDSRTSRWAGKIGEYSYSIYLLHMFVVFDLAAFVHERVMDISNFYMGLAWALLCFLVFLPVAAASYHLIEKPFFALRRPYTVQ